MPLKGQKSVTLGEQLLERVKRLIKRRMDLGYTNPTEFIKDAIRRRLDEIESTEKLSFRKEAD